MTGSNDTKLMYIKEILETPVEDQEMVLNVIFTKSNVGVFSDTPDIIKQIPGEFPNVLERSISLNFGASSFKWAMLGIILLSSTATPEQKDCLKTIISTKIDEFEAIPGEKKYSRKSLRKESTRKKIENGTINTHSGENLKNLPVFSSSNGSVNRINGARCLQSYGL